MARRHKRLEQHSHHERWVVSYADFITLLFAFFVVMYSISSVNEGKYRVLSHTLTDAFKESARSLEPIQVGNLSRAAGGVVGPSEQRALITTNEHLGPGAYADPGASQADDSVEMPPTSASEQQRLSFLAAAIEDMLEPYVEQDLVEVQFSGDRVIVDMKDKMLFPSGSARLSRTAVRALRDISRILVSMPNKIQVEGNTDNRPIHTDAFPSNWELSAVRAASVAHLMTRMGIAPERLSAIGYGEYRPVADNTREEGRQKNRRVTLVIEGLQATPEKSAP